MQGFKIADNLHFKQNMLNLIDFLERTVYIHLKWIQDHESCANRMYACRARVRGERASKTFAAPLEVTLSSLEWKTIF